MRIVVAHTLGYEPWLGDCLRSLQDIPYKVEVIEPGGWVTDQLKFAGNLAAVWHEPIFFLNETVIIHDPSLFDEAESIEGPAALSPGYLSFMGKFTPEQLRPVEWPEVKTKKDDVILGEGHLMRDKLAPGVPVLCSDFVDPDMHDPTQFVDRHGRRNLVLSNKYLTKYKATWTI